jgi:hypothetical protein
VSAVAACVFVVIFYTHCFWSTVEPLLDCCCLLIIYRQRWLPLFGILDANLCRWEFSCFLQIIHVYLWKLAIQAVADLGIVSSFLRGLLPRSHDRILSNGYWHVVCSVHIEQHSIIWHTTLVKLRVPVAKCVPCLHSIITGHVQLVGFSYIH